MSAADTSSPHILFHFSNVNLTHLEINTTEESLIINILVFRQFEFQEKETTNSGYKQIKKVLRGILNLTFRMLQHTSSEVTESLLDV